MLLPLWGLVLWTQPNVSPGEPLAPLAWSLNLVAAADGNQLAVKYTAPDVCRRSVRVDFAHNRGISSVGRALAWHARGQGFKSPILHFSEALGIPPKGFFYGLASRKPAWIAMIRRPKTSPRRSLEHDHRQASAHNCKLSGGCSTLQIRFFEKFAPDARYPRFRYP